MLRIDLDQSAEDRLRTEAEAKGMPAEAYAKEILERMLLPSAGQKLVEQWRRDGVIGSLANILEGERYAQELRETTWQRGEE